jgi:hypothetical protein
MIKIDLNQLKNINKPYFVHSRNEYLKRYMSTDFSRTENQNQPKIESACIDIKRESQRIYKAVNKRHSNLSDSICIGEETPKMQHETPIQLSEKRGSMLLSQLN